MPKQLLFHTDVLIDYLRGVQEAVAYLESRQEVLLVSAVTVAELYAGVREGQERTALGAFVGAFEVLPLDQAIAEKGGLLRRDYGKSQGTRIGRCADRGHRRASAGNAGDAEPQALPDVEARAGAIRLLTARAAKLSLRGLRLSLQHQQHKRLHERPRQSHDTRSCKITPPPSAMPDRA